MKYEYAVDKDERIRQYQEAFKTCNADIVETADVVKKHPYLINIMQRRNEKYIELKCEFAGYLRALVDTNQINVVEAVNKLIAERINFNFSNAPYCDR